MGARPDFQAILLKAWANENDPAHDIGHIRRVVANAHTIAQAEGGDLNIITPAAWLHDIVNLPKDHPDRTRASVISADHAVAVLDGYGLDLDAIHHAIAAHSFSANIPPRTLEAKIVQDADRLDALGAIGLARMFAVGGALRRPLFDADDVLAEGRAPDDTRYSLDHIQVKLLKVAQTLHTKAARAMAASRVDFMQEFARRIAAENQALEGAVREDRAGLL